MIEPIQVRFPEEKHFLEKEKNGEREEELLTFRHDDLKDWSIALSLRLASLNCSLAPKQLHDKVVNSWEQIILSLFPVVS